VKFIQTGSGGASCIAQEAPPELCMIGLSIYKQDAPAGANALYYPVHFYWSNNTPLGLLALHTCTAGILSGIELNADWYKNKTIENAVYHGGNGIFTIDNCY